MSELSILRMPAEQLYAEELEAIIAADTNVRPPGWKMSPAAVLLYIAGGKVGKKNISTKYYGQKRLLEIALATLATERGLLLLGVPGTAKTWLSEHLAAAISGNSRLMIQGTAGTQEEAIRYGWNYASLLSEGPTENALVKTPVYHAMESGRIARIEELTRLSSDVQDALITILSEKTLPIPELNRELRAVQGFNLIATANDRDRGVNDLSSALRRRFNTLIMPLPAKLEEEVKIVSARMQETMPQLAATVNKDTLVEINRLVLIFRELREGISQDGKVKLKSPSSTLSTAEAIAVMQNGITLAQFFGNGQIRVEDLAAGLQGAVIKDPEADKMVWKEYIELVMKNREPWKDLYKACRELLD